MNITLEVDRLNNLIDGTIEKNRKEIRAMRPQYLMESLKGTDKHPIFNKVEQYVAAIKDLSQLSNLIRKIKWVKADDDFKNYLNPYGIIFDRETMHYDDCFFSFDEKTRTQAILIEIFNSFTQTNYKNEAFLILCHMNILDYKPKYARSTRGKIIRLAESNGFFCDYDLFVRPLKTKKFLQKVYLKNHPEIEKVSDIPYACTTQGRGWDFSSEDRLSTSQIIEEA